ncbi:MAG: OmpA family protein [Phycisphaerales bacterium]|nr:OmpA family protein [Phycisphaerales bacterium]
MPRTGLSNFNFKIIGFLLLVFLYANKSIGQKDSIEKKVACDCKAAIPITVFKKTSYGKTLPPNGFGNLLEIKANTNSSKTAFEKEHHSAWYLLDIKASGKLTFDIAPMDKGNDYDFLLFTMTDSLSCDSILSKSKQPVRGNLSRNDTTNGSITGLSSKGTADFTSKGVGNQFSNPLFVDNGEKYLLVLDNVYDNGQGHKIDFKIERKVKVSGKVSDETGRPLVADIELVNDIGNKILTTKSNIEGTFRIEASFNIKSNYTLIYRAPDKQIAVEKLQTENLKARDTLLKINTQLKSIVVNSYLPTLKWFFYPDDYKLRPESNTALNQLLVWMQDNPKVSILIEGNMTSPGKSSVMNTIVNTPDAWRQEWSEKRALGVRKYLITNGIDSNRITTIGNSMSKKIYSNPQNDYEHKMNDRIEVKIIGIRK